MRQRLTSFRNRIAKFADLTRRGWIIERRYGAALGRLRRSRTAAVELLVEATSHADWRVRWRATALLMDWGEECYVPGLMPLVDDPAMPVREFAVWAIGRIGGAVAVTFLRERLLHGQGNLSSLVVGLLYNGSASIPVFEEAMGSDNPDVRFAGATGLLGASMNPNRSEKTRRLAQESIVRQDAEPETAAIFEAARRHLGIGE